jgi:ribosomal peptide maturation radical SAM protein 1
MNCDNKKILLIAMPFAGTTIPSIQLGILESYLKEHDIDITTKHLYLKAAEFYGLINYNFLINRPSDSYTAQMIYSRYVFPKHWDKTENLFIEYFNRILSESKEFKENFSFEKYIRKTDQFYNWTVNNINWEDYDLIGFTLNYGQLLPSLAIAKKIKECFPDKKIIFGGSRTTDDLARRILKSFKYIDYTVSGDGEEPLYFLATNYDNLNSIPNLTFRQNDEIIKNSTKSVIDINSLPFSNFDSFFKDLISTSDDVKQYFYYYGRLPVEISRGCWWNKCTFCNHNVQHKTYREKKCGKIIEEIEFLSNRYKMLDFHLNGNNIIKKDFHLLIDGLKRLERDFSFIVEVRADQLKSYDYESLKEAGFTIIQTGVESFSQSYLKKMNKGTRVIDNIAALKFCKENRIWNSYNIIVNYPNEEKIDFEETKENIAHIKYYLDPPNVNNLLVGYGSPIFDNPEDFNIENFENTKIDKLIFPEGHLKENFSFFYDFKRKKQMPKNDWVTIIAEWRSIQDEIASKLIKKQTVADRLVFYFVDGGKFLKIIDKRYADNVRIYNLDEIEREIFLSCIDITSYDEMSEKFSHIPDYQLISTLRTFEKMGIVFVEDNHYLSLPLNYKRCIGIKKEKKIADNFVKEEITK